MLYIPTTLNPNNTAASRRCSVTSTSQDCCRKRSSRSSRRTRSARQLQKAGSRSPKWTRSWPSWKHYHRRMYGITTSHKFCARTIILYSRFVWRQILPLSHTVCHAEKIGKVIFARNNIVGHCQPGFNRLYIYIYIYIYVCIYISLKGVLSQTVCV